jgi:opacity protein-like surface antigen
VKKVSLLVLLITVLVTGTAFAQPAFRISAGAGGFFANDFGGGVETSGNIPSYGAVGAKMEIPNSGGGAFAFFDATYVELSVGYFSGIVKAKTSVYYPPSLPVPLPSYNINGNYKLSTLNIGLFGKYPFTINDKFSLFPLLGIEVSFGLSSKCKDGEEYTIPDGDKTPSKDWSAIWFKAGVGGDYSLTDQIYVRLNLLYGIRGPNNVEGNASFPGEKSDTILGHGLTAKLAVGYRF